MKQRLYKVLSWFCCVALIASAVVGALSASVLFASADSPDQTDDIGVEDIREQLLYDYPEYHSFIDDFFDDYVNEYIQTPGYWVCALNEGTAWLISVYYNLNNGNVWYSYGYTQYSSTRSGLSRQENAGSNGYNGVQCIRYLHAHNGDVNTGSLAQNQSLQFTSAVNLFGSLTGGWLCACPTTYNFAVAGRKCYISVPVLWGNGGFDMDVNLIPGHAPQYIEFNWFKFQLGSRWFVTTVDQSLFQNMQYGDDTFWMFSFDVTSSQSVDPLTVYVLPEDVQKLFISEEWLPRPVTNIPSTGYISCYEITDLIGEGYLSEGTFYNVTSEDVVIGVVAYSEDAISLVISEEEKNKSDDQSWQQINNYIENYPTLTIVPEQLAAQLSGNSAIGSGFAYVRAPVQIRTWVDSSVLHTETNTAFEYDLSQSGLDPSYLSMINFEILDEVIVPAPWLVLDNVILSQWDTSFEYLVDSLGVGYVKTNQIGTFDYESPYWNNYDLILIGSHNSRWLGDTNLPTDIANFGNTAYVGDIVRTELTSENVVEPVYFILTQRAIQKSQLYVFCDSQSKLYKLLSEYINKRDLWDNSFLDWSMSMYLKLETLNGHLSSIETEVLNWHLGDKIQDLISKADQIVQNTNPIDEESVDPWYLSLWNFILQFKPSNSQISTGIDYIDQNLDDIPLLPYLTPVPALPTPGGG